MNLQNIIHQELHLTINVNSLSIKELQNINKEATLKEVTISGLPNNVFAYSLDKNSFVNSFLQNDSENLYISKKCDAIITQRIENTIDIIILDLKSKNWNNDDCSYKLINEKLRIDYFISLLNMLHNESITYVNYKYAIFYLARIKPKPSVRTEKSKEPKFNYTTENMRLFNEKFLALPFSKETHNFIEWSDLKRML